MLIHPLIRGDMIIRNRSLPKTGNGYGASPLRRFRFSAGILGEKKIVIIGTRFRGSKLGF